MTSSYEELKQISRSQKRQQVALAVLSIALAASTIITWKAVAAMREANEIHKQLIESRKPGSTAKATLRKPNLRAETRADADPHHAPGLTHPGGQKRTVERPAPAGSAPNAPLAATNTLLARPGRQ
jgi:hypothetical protein